MLSNMPLSAAMSLETFLQLNDVHSEIIIPFHHIILQSDHSMAPELMHLKELLGWHRGWSFEKW